MNSSSFIEPSLLVQNLTMTTVESWFIPLDISLIICCIVILIESIFLLSIMFLDKTCHTIPMMLIANTYISGLLIGCTMLGIAIFTFQNDLKQIQYQDSLCVWRYYLMYITGAAYNYSFLFQALYRYFIAIHPTNLFFQSFRFQILIICSSWLFNFVYPFACLFDGQIIYNVDNQMCLIPPSFSFPTIYMPSCLFLCPFSLIMFIYWKLIRHVREIGKNVMGTNNLTRVQRELKMVRRIVILIAVLATICFPFTIMVWMGFFNHAPKYHGRISFVFFEFSGLISELILFYFTDPLKASVMKRAKLRSNRIVPTMTYK